MKRLSLCFLVFVAALAFTVPRVLAHPGSGIVVDARGRVYFNDVGDPDTRTPGAIWQIDAEGKVTRLQSGGAHWLALDTRRSFSQTNLTEWFKRRVTPWLQRAGTPDAALIQADGQPIVVHHDGSLYYAKRNLEITRLAPDGTQTAVAPSLEQTADRLGGIKGLALGSDDSLYVACPGAILKVKTNGTVSTMIDRIVVPECARDLPANIPESQLPSLRGLAVNANGTVYAAATGCRCVVKISPGGQVSVLLRAERPWSPTGVAVRGEDLYVLEYSHANSEKRADWRPRVRKVEADGTVTTLFGRAN